MSVGAVTRTSSLTNVGGASIPRQQEAIEKYVAGTNKVAATLVLKGVARSVPFMERPGIEDFLDDRQKRGIGEIVLADEKRLHSEQNTNST